MGEWERGSAEPQLGKARSRDNLSLRSTNILASPVAPAPAELRLGAPGEVARARSAGHAPPVGAPPIRNRRLVGETGSKPVGEERDGLGVATGADAGPGVARRASHGSAGMFVGKRVLTRATHAGGGFGGGLGWQAMRRRFETGV